MITIEQLESLANELEHDDVAHRERLLRLCRAYVRILAVREPSLWVRGACHYGDVAGSWDNSFPPRQVYNEHIGPLMITLIESETDDIPLTGGFYYAWRRATTYGGLSVGLGGEGSGRFSAFAAHPGDCDVHVTITWQATRELTTEELVTAELALRELAFPLTAAKIAE